MQIDKLRRYSPITYFFERLFFFLQFTSIANILYKTRTEAQKDFSDIEKREEITIRRGRRIEYYMIIWFLILIICAFLIPRLPKYKFMLFILPMYRIIEIMQYAVNMNIFDRLRINSHQHYVSGLTRTLVLSLWNFAELLFCFGIIYSGLLVNIKNAKSIADAYYFSFITQLTIGYGDLAPLGIVKLLAPLQGVMGFMFGLFVLSRLVALLPRVRTVQSDN